MRASASLLRAVFSCVAVLGGVCFAQSSFPGDFLSGIPFGTYDTWGVASGDFNGDGKLDVATVSLNAATLKVFLGNGDGTLTAGYIYSFNAAANGPYALVATHVNGDGKLDLTAVCYNALGVTGGGAASVSFGNGAGFHPFWRKIR